jgi:hypothetical protein
VKVTTHHHLVPTLRMSGAILSFPYVPSWRRQGKLYLFTCTLPMSCMVYYSLSLCFYLTSEELINLKFIILLSSFLVLPSSTYLFTVDVEGFCNFI